MHRRRAHIFDAVQSVISYLDNGKHVVGMPALVSVSGKACARCHHSRWK